MVATKKTHPYYNFNKVCSYNAVINMIAGGRGIGKTYGAKKRAVDRFIKRGEQFIYMRRYKSELKGRTEFFADFGHLYPDYDFRVEGFTAQIAHKTSREDKKRPWLTMGYFMALSTAQSVKSVPYPLVTTVIFDEFIIEKGAVFYLPDEWTILLNFYNTVDRYQDKTTFFLLANAVSITNPYFLALGIIPEPGKEFTVMNDGFVCVQFPDSADFALSIYETRFGKFIKETEYAEYAVGNLFNDNHDSMLALKDPQAKYQFSLETDEGEFSVWFNLFTNHYYVREKLPKDQIRYTLLSERMTAEKTLVNVSDKRLEYLRSGFRSGRVSFDKPPARNAFIKIFKR